MTFPEYGRRKMQQSDARPSAHRKLLNMTPDTHDELFETGEVLRTC